MTFEQIWISIFVGLVLSVGFSLLPILFKDMPVRIWRQMMAHNELPMVVSEPEIQLALNHLRSLPFRRNLHRSWDRQRLLLKIQKAAAGRRKIGQLLEIAPGVFGIIKPFGVDLAKMEDFDGRLQVWIAIRSVGTNPDLVTQV